ncbi:hypothetical protein CLOP_g11972 [Closterium sp. NIES-67]|nr:hypothetical protein CLOP_g11972 [Closterium sp. NIES-67]
MVTGNHIMSHGNYIISHGNYIMSHGNYIMSHGNTYRMISPSGTQIPKNLPLLLLQLVQNLLWAFGWSPFY